jgi:hypothetical protein
MAGILAHLEALAEGLPSLQEKGLDIPSLHGLGNSCPTPLLATLPEHPLQQFLVQQAVPE